MLKEYHEWNCDGDKTCAVVVKTIPDAVCGKCETVEGTRWNQTIYVILE